MSKALLLAIFALCYSSINGQINWKYNNVNTADGNFKLAQVVTTKFGSDASIGIMNDLRGNYQLILFNVGEALFNRPVQKVTIGISKGSDNWLYDFSMNKFEQSLHINIYPFGEDKDFITSLKNGSEFSVLLNGFGYSFTLNGSGSALAKTGL
jgi:hypothetical protein